MAGGRDPGADLDTGRETRLLIVDRVTAGHTARSALSSGQAIRIFTGAPIPDGADAVARESRKPRNLVAPRPDRLSNRHIRVLSRRRSQRDRFGVR